MQASVAILFLGACSPQLSRTASPEVLASGAEVYDMACAQCHYDGKASAANPALIGSPALAAAPDVTARIILRGQSGKSLVDGKPLGGIMPPQPYLTDEEIAAVVTYVRSQFGGVSQEFSPAEVAKIRAAGR